jgi:hypothetical protein
MINFCTLFDVNYLSRGLALYESLLRSGEDFHLYIFPFDDLSYKILVKLELKHASIVPLKDFEDEELLNLKPGRSKVEYCWTCTPSVILYSIKKFGLERCTYLDADTYFFEGPSLLFEEFKNGVSVIITQHRYTPKYDMTKESGKYCVQFVAVNNDDNGMKVLEWWRAQCNKWCYCRSEDGKFGDQKYLDDWPERFNGVCDLVYQGGGLAPWNIQQYDVFEKNNSLFCVEKSSGAEFKVVFFHFHALKFFDNGTLKLNNDHDTAFAARKLIYKPYIIHLLDICRRIKLRWPDIDINATIKERKKFSRLAERIKNMIRRKKYESVGVYDINEFNGIWRLMSWHI